jgi:colanic acid/amylovoran biosynthesis glycosyltransferase
LRRSIAVLDQWPFDVIVCHFGPVGRDLQEVRDAGVTTRPMVTFFHGYDVSRTIAERGSGFYRRLFEAGDQLLPISDYWRRKLIELGAPPERTLVHRMGVDCRKIAFRARSLAESEPVQILSVARLTEKKGLEFALRALARLPRAQAFRYHLVGDGELRPALEREVDELGLRERVTFHGWKTQGEIAKLLERSHLLLQPSVTASDGDQEGIPVVLMEAMAAGLPVLSTLHTGIPELVDDGASGYLVPERDVAALAERLSDLIAHPERWPEFGRHGRSRVETHFDVNVLNDQLAERLRSLVARQAASA